MTDDIFTAIAKRFDTETDYGLKDGLLLVASSLTVKAVKKWLGDSYPDEKIPEASVPFDLGDAHFWLLDKRLSPPSELIASLADRGLIAELRTVVGVEAVYVPPQGVARRRAARLN